jgi:hypothetical protein
VTAHSESLSGAGTGSLEVRWIFRGQLADATAAWFDRFPAAMTAVEDAYLLEPYLPGLSVKVRGGRALEVKVYQGSLGLLRAAGRVCGRVESWKKWSFPHGPATEPSGNRGGWMLVSKRRRISWFSLAGEPFPAGVQGLGEEPRCAVELTEARVGRAAWWTLGFEATGPVGLQRSALESAAAVVFAQALPCGVRLGRKDSMSYQQWLRPRSGAGVTPKPEGNTPVPTLSLRALWPCPAALRNETMDSWKSSITKGRLPDPPPDRRQEP